MIAKMIDVKTEDGICDAYLAYPEGKNNLPFVLFYMDAIGLRKRIHDMVDRIAAQGYFVLAPNLFYRSKRAPVVDYETLLKPEHRGDLIKQVMALASELKVDMGERDARSFLNYARARPEVDVSRAAAVGYCMGGGNALRSAGNFPEAFAAVASFHAGNLATEAETSPHRWFPRIKAEVYIGHADRDQHMPPEQMERVEAELKKAGLRCKAELYPECHHGWTMSDLHAYNKEGEARHWKELFALFQRNLRTEERK